MKRYLKRCLALLLSVMLLLSALPTALAANSRLVFNEDDARRYGVISGYAYTVSVDAPGTENDGFFTEMTPTIKFNSIDYGKPIEPDNKAVLTFHNVGEKDLNLTFGSCTYADVKWIEGSEKIAVGESAKLEVTLRENIPVAHGSTGLLLMEQNSRVGWTALLDIEVQPISVQVTAADMTKTYGRTLTAVDLTVNVSGGITSLSELETMGYTITSEGFSADAAVGTYPVAVTASESANFNYDVENDESIATVTVDRAEPELVWVNASSVRSGAQLAESKLEGAYRNPDSGAEVAGTFAWKDPGAVDEVQDGQSAACTRTYIFTPDDDKNYKTVEDTATLTVVGKDLTTIQLAPTAQLNVTYDGKAHPVAFTADHGTVKVQYAPTGTETWTEEAPKAVGTYQVQATVEESDTYASDSYSTVLTINPVSVVLRLAEPDAITSRQYNGMVDATLNLSDSKPELSVSGRIQFGGVVSGDHLTIDYTQVKAVYDDPNVGRDKTVTVTVPKDAVGGDLANYSFEGQTFITKGDIFVLPVELTMKANITKQYGQSTQIVDADYDVPGLVEGEQKDALHVELYSQGVEPVTAVGSYPVTVKNSWGNYSVSKVNGTFTVVPTTPVTAGTVSAGNGGVDRLLSTVALSGTFQNPYTGEIVPGTLDWTAPSTTLPSSVGDTTAYDWTFTPNDAKNYNATVGTAEVTTTAKEPVNVQFAVPEDLIYDGQPKTAVGKSTYSGASITVQYKSSGAASWDSAAPTDAGTYDVLVSADVSDTDEYADNSITGTMVIQPATPAGTATAEKPETDVMLGDVALIPAFTGVDGAPLTGTLSWNTVGGELPGAVPVQYDTAYGWTFTPDDSNYTAVSGTVTFDAPPADDDDDDDNNNPGGDDPGNNDDEDDDNKPGGDNPGGNEDDPGDKPGGSTGGGSSGDASDPGDSTEDPTDEPIESGVERLLNVETVIPFMSGFEDGTFRPDESVSRAMVAQIFYNLLIEQNVDGEFGFPEVSVDCAFGFKDVASRAWYAQAVVTLANLDIISGTYLNGTGSTFEPDRPITRAEFAVIAAKFANAADGGKTFSDVSGHWAAGSIRTASAYGWINGDGDGTFRPNDPINRAEAASIVNKMLGRTSTGAGKSFPDVPKTHWAYNAIQMASASN